MRSIIVNCLLCAGFFVVEALFRQGDEARSMDAGPADQGTSRLIGLGFLFTLTSVGLAPLLARVGVGRASGARTLLTGRAMMVAGLALKVWAMLTLGRFYTRTLRAAPDQTVVEAGPYRVVRHPGYLATLLIWVGFGWSMRNWITATANTLVLLAVYGRRLAVEEGMLVERFGDTYRSYQRRTWRLVPGLV